MLQRTHTHTDTHEEENPAGRSSRGNGCGTTVEGSHSAITLAVKKS